MIKSDTLMIEFREANINDLELLEYWGRKKHVIENAPGDWNWEYELKRKPFWREQLIVEFDKAPIAFVQIIDPFHEETHYWGEIEENKRAIDIWIGEEENFNKGYGTKIMNLVIDRCFQQNEVTGIVIDPMVENVKAIRFYKKLGFEYIEDRILDGNKTKVFEFKR